MSDTLSVQHTKCAEAQAVDEIIAKEERIKFLSAQAVAMSLRIMNYSDSLVKTTAESMLSDILEEVDELKAEVYGNHD